LLSACFKDRLMKNKQTAMSAEKTPSFHDRLSNVSLAVDE
jgi:hypothetical protein